MINLKEKKVLLTGASGGIGRAIAEDLIAQGAHVCLTGRNKEELRKLQSELGENTTISIADLSNSNEIDTLVKDAEEKLGHIDILVNNAGITDDNIFLRMSDEQWNSVINVNLNSTFKKLSLGQVPPESDSLSLPLVDGLFGRYWEWTDSYTIKSANPNGVVSYTERIETPHEPSQQIMGGGQTDIFVHRSASGRR